MTRNWLQMGARNPPTADSQATRKATDFDCRCARTAENQGIKVTFASSFRRCRLCWLAGLAQGASFLTIGQQILTSDEFSDDAAAQG
jgi:hypothetical protein